MTRRSPPAWPATAVLSLCLIMGGAVFAQTGRTFAPGELVQVSPSETLKVLECRMNTVGRYTECRAVAWKNGGPASNPAWMDGGEIAKAEARMRASAGAIPASRAAPAPSGGRACPRTPYGGPVSGATPASKALFQRKVADTYTMGAYGPYWYGVTFESFEVGAPIRNAVGRTPGGAASRVNNGAPVGALMYPVSSRHVVCEGAPTSAERRRVSVKYLCFVSKANEWTCGADSQ